MGLTQVPRKESRSPVDVSTSQADCIEWVKYAACGSLIASGVLLLTGQRRAGLVAGVSGAALAMLDQQDLLSAWWKQLPGYVDQVQHLVDQVQNTVEEVAVRRESLRQVLNKAENAG
jgi:hypothetical protein